MRVRDGLTFKRVMLKGTDDAEHSHLTVDIYCADKPFEQFQSILSEE